MSTSSIKCKRGAVQCVNVCLSDRRRPSESMAWTLMWHGTVLTDTDRYPLMLRQIQAVQSGSAQESQINTSVFSPCHSSHPHKTLSLERYIIKTQKHVIYKLRAYRKRVLTSCNMIGQFWWVTAHKPIKTQQLREFSHLIESDLYCHWKACLLCFYIRIHTKNVPDDHSGILQKNSRFKFKYSWQLMKYFKH